MVCANWLIRKSMTHAYVTLVTLPPKSLWIGGHFEFWAANGLNGRQKNAKNIFGQFQLIILAKNHIARITQKFPQRFFCDIRECTY